MTRKKAKKAFNVGMMARLLWVVTDLTVLVKT